MSVRTLRRSGIDLAAASDGDLIEHTRAGKTDAFGELWIRHERAALAFARTLSPSYADDLVAEAFARILRVLQKGQGPVENFRAYLCVAIKSCFIDEYRRSAKSVSVGHDEILDALGNQGVEPDHADLHGVSDAVRAAWSKLERREQWLMWASAVQGYSTSEIATRLGIKPGTAAVWVYRARERARIAFLASQVQAASSAECQRQRDRFVGYVRQTLGERRRKQVSEHLDSCADCSSALQTMSDVNHRMRAVVWPLLPPSTTAAFHLAGHAASVGVHPLIAHALSAKVATVSASVVASIAVGATIVSQAPFDGSNRTLADDSPALVRPRAAVAPARPPAAPSAPRSTTSSRAPVPSPPAAITSPVRQLVLPSAPPPRSSPSAAPATTTTASGLLASAPTTSTPTTALPAPPASAITKIISTRIATFAIPVPDPTAVTATITLSVAPGSTVTGTAVSGLTGSGGVQEWSQASNTIAVLINSAQVAGGVLTIVLTAVGAFGPGDTAAAAVVFTGTPAQTITAPLA